MGSIVLVTDDAGYVGSHRVVDWRETVTLPRRVAPASGSCKLHRETGPQQRATEMAGMP